MITVLLGITGGIAAIKIPKLVPELKKQGCNVVICMTPSATAIVKPAKLEKISGNRVYTQMFSESFNSRRIVKNRRVDHIAIAKQSSVFVIAPATANCIAKLSRGIADDYITTTALAVRCPVLIFPSMNTSMWKHPATKQNISRCRDLGYSVYDPSSGPLACGDEGKGRLPPLSDIEKEIIRVVTRTDILKGKTVIVTSGGTIEKIDDIRFITNKSSGKTGAALADAATLSGASVLLLRARNSESPRYPCEEYLFETADELERLIRKYIRCADVCIHAAAVSDFTVKHPFTGKTSGSIPLPLELTPRTKILDTMKARNPKLFLVAFKAEWNVTPKKLVSLATKRLSLSHADMIIANDVAKPGVGFTSDNNEVYIINANGKVTHIPRASKTVIAEKIIDGLVKQITLSVSAK
jgi:phosphopantothenoylcysteine decarboxylase / phosphopantothenate---cysteine ligase